MWIELLLFVVLISFIFYKWARVNDDFFVKRNVEHLKPTFLLGNNEGKITATNFANKIYRTFPNKP